MSETTYTTETPYATVGEFKATYWDKADRYYLYYGTRRVGEINSGKPPEEVYGSVEGWVKHVVKRSNKRLEKINEQVSDLVVEQAGLDKLIRAAAKIGVDS